MDRGTPPPTIRDKKRLAELVDREPPPDDPGQYRVSLRVWSLYPPTIQDNKVCSRSGARDEPGPTGEVARDGRTAGVEPPTRQDKHEAL